MRPRTMKRASVLLLAQVDVPQGTGYGERTDEEMCFGFTFVGF